MDSKGFRVLTDEHDLYRLFTEKNKGKRYDEDDDFARLFEKSQQDRRQRLMMKEKKGAPDKPNTTPLTPRERIKVYPAPQRELDLHGFTAVQAETRTEAFIRGARQNDIRTVRIIVGKGRHSNGKAVLPDLIEKKIIELKGKQWVLAFKWEKKDKRKSGAIIVYLLPDRNPL